MIQPEQIQPLGKTQTMVLWEDDEVSTFSNVFLQLSCQCAQCVDEMTGEVRINESEIDDKTELLRVERVGGYGVRFKWTSGCENGIYSFEYLRKLHDAQNKLKSS